MRIAISADHAGFELKEHLKRRIADSGHAVLDLGTDSTDSVDYPDYSAAVGRAIVAGHADRGIVVCGSGAGAAIAANKLDGIRCAQAADTYTAHQAVEHDDINMLALAARVTGVALAEENDSGVVGLAPKCSFMPIRMSTWLTDQSVVDMFQYVIDNHADVVSCSWSAGAWNFPLSLKMTGIIHKAATQGRSNGKGCVILFAAGNENRPLKGKKDNKVSHQGFALHADVLAIAASNSLDLRSGYSNFGSQIAVCAPSSGSPGRGIVTTDRRGAGGYSNTDYTHSFGGTSSATPLVAGLAGLVLSLDGELSSAQVREIIQQSADKIDPDNGDYQNGHSPLYGAGRINAERALKLVAGNDEADRLPETLLLEHRVNKPIPDQGQLIDTITFAEDVDIRQIEIKVDIRHTWRNDLRVVLISPSRNEIILFNQTGGSKDDIVATIRSSDEAELFAGLISQSAQGVWQLRIEDTARQDVGVLKSWGLGVTY